VYELSGKWATGSTYGTAIKGIVDMMIAQGYITCGLW
jgi:hypothetical protein